MKKQDWVLTKSQSYFNPNNISYERKNKLQQSLCDCVTVRYSRLRTTILAGSNGIGGKGTGEDFTFGSRDRKKDVQTTNID